MQKTSVLFFCMLILVLSTCKKEGPGEPVPMDCDDLEILKMELQEASENENRVKDIAETTQHYTITLEDGKSYELDRGCLVSYTLSNLQWTIVMEYHDGSKQTLGYIGELDLGFELNPYGHCPLGALVDVKAPVSGKVRIRIIGKNGSYSDVNASFDDFKTNQEVPVAGLYANYLNQVEIIFTKEDGTERVRDTLKIQTAPLLQGLPEIEVDVRKENRMKEGWTLVSSLSIWNPNIPYMFDPYGDIRWYLNYKDHESLAHLFYDVGIEQLANGNLYFGNLSNSIIYEIGILGEVINKWPLPPGYYIHHNIQEKPDGNFLVTINREGRTHENGLPTVEDGVIEIDRSSGALVHEWNFLELLDENRTALIDNLSHNPIDWVHLNAVIYDESDHSIIVSGRTQGVIKVDYNNQIKWILAPHEGWTQNRLGEDLNQYLLTALDGNGNPLTEDAQKGYVNHSAFEWNWYQHAPEFMPNGNIILFDNGDRRNFQDIHPKYSRAVEFEIDEENKTVRQVWQYGKERQWETFSSIVSDVDYLSEENHVIFSPGSWVYNGGDLKGAKVIELNYTTKEIIFEARINDPNNGITLHRTERMRLYPK